jgi:hypothetical protein
MSRVAWQGVIAPLRSSARERGGVDLRYSRAEVEIRGVDLEAGGVYVGVLVGFRLGGS